MNNLHTFYDNTVASTITEASSKALRAGKSGTMRDAIIQQLGTIAPNKINASLNNKLHSILSGECEPRKTIGTSVLLVEKPSASRYF